MDTESVMYFTTFLAIGIVIKELLGYPKKLGFSSLAGLGIVVINIITIVLD